MTHERRFEGDDPYLARLRPIALAFPDAEELVSHGRPCFRAGRIFAVLGSGTKGGAGQRVSYPHGLLVLLDEEERLAMADDPRCFVPAYYGPYGWLGVDLAAGGGRADRVDWQEVAELLDSSYRQVAGRSRVTRLDAEGSPALSDRRA